MEHMGGQLLQGKVIVISGGTKGIGRGLVAECAAQGARVVFGGRDKAAAEEICREVQDATGQACLFVYSDLRHIEDCKALFDTAMGRFGEVNGFVNYAGITPIQPLTETEEKTFDQVFTLNTKAAFFCAKHAVRCMQKTGGGSIVLFGSVHTWVGEKNRAAYACSKGALHTLCEHIAHHYAEDQIRCNYLTMGWVPTEGELALRAAHGLSAEDLHKTAVKSIPMGRMQTVEDHIPGVVYLLSDASAMVTGSNLRVTGGSFVG